ncbi:unnamed protein product [Cyprideis torosa]|uniref:aconitate hydratase n=1 Tax=Cyprideis torosa TaxID=163714 RepID=A0A7R8W1G5_9CRUS|nr:unnamed protein product [Cyprideis torosa]CAG0878738.1 unnamed protein product [Cyprideis torosa]
MSSLRPEPQALTVGEDSYQIFPLDALPEQDNIARLPFSLKVLLENLCRTHDGVNTTDDDLQALIRWDAKAGPGQEIAFTPARVLMQDFTGVPAVVDLAAMRDAMRKLGGDPARINPLSPADLVIDHSVMVDHFGKADSLDLNAMLEFQRNAERYSFLKWGQQAFDDFRVVPPATGIVHQVNLEYLAPVVFTRDVDGQRQAYPDTVVGTDSHTTMINGLGVLGWGVGGIEAEAAMLGQPVSMLIPEVIGFKLIGQLKAGATATDLVLTVTQMLRARGVVGKFVEFFGDGLDAISLADKATIANMAPEYGATCGFFPLDAEALEYMRLSGRDESQIALVEAYARKQGLFRVTGAEPANYTDVLELDLGEVEPSLAGPKRPQDRIALSAMKSTVETHLNDSIGGTAQPVSDAGQSFELCDGDVVIAAITSCTNTSNPDVIMAAGLLARNAIARGLKTRPWVKTSLAPGSQVVTEYLRSAGLMESLEQLGFDIVGYGCTTCIGNSGPLPDHIALAVSEGKLNVASVLSGNRNFEGRVHAQVTMNFLASPPLVVAYALAGTTRIDFDQEPIGHDKEGKDVYLSEIWPDLKNVRAEVQKHVTREMFQSKYADVFKGDKRWQNISTPASKIYEWRDDSTYIQHPPYFEGMSLQADGIPVIAGARVLARLGDSITTDHISPAGSFKADHPAGQYLIEKGVSPGDFNSYGSRRGNHEVMMRGTFANVRLRNELAPGSEGGFTCHQPSGEQMTIYDAAVRYRKEGTALIVIAGKEYGTGSSRDWAAKGSLLLGVRAVIAESYERIHRSNLIGMGVLPLQFEEGTDRNSLNLSGTESYSIEAFDAGAKSVTVTVSDDSGHKCSFTACVRIDTPKEWDYYCSGGILKYVLRQLVNQ